MLHRVTIRWVKQKSETLIASIECSLRIVSWTNMPHQSRLTQLFLAMKSVSSQVCQALFTGIVKIWRRWRVTTCRLLMSCRSQSKWRIMKSPFVSQNLKMKKVKMIMNSKNSTSMIPSCPKSIELWTVAWAWHPRRHNSAVESSTQKMPFRN